MCEPVTQEKQFVVVSSSALFVPVRYAVFQQTIIICVYYPSVLSILQKQKQLVYLSHLHTEKFWKKSFECCCISVSIY